MRNSSYLDKVRNLDALLELVREHELSKGKIAKLRHDRLVARQRIGRTMDVMKLSKAS